MTDLKRDVQDDQGIKKAPTRENSERQAARRRPRTGGTDRDFDETGTSKNQAHGHPREERRARAERPAGDADATRPARSRRLPGAHEGQGPATPTTSGDGSAG